MAPPTWVGGREGGFGGGGGLAIPILNRKFSDCRIFSPLSCNHSVLRGRNRGRSLRPTRSPACLSRNLRFVICLHA